MGESRLGYKLIAQQYQKTYQVYPPNRAQEIDDAAVPTTQCMYTKDVTPDQLQTNTSTLNEYMVTNSSNHFYLDPTLRIELAMTDI